MNVGEVFAALVFMLPLLSAKPCGVPGRPVDGWFGPTNNTYQPGATVVYFCEPRNLIFGAVSRTCQKDGTWSDDVPVCDKPTPVKEVFQSSTLGILTANRAVDGNYSSYSSTGLQEKGYWTAVLEKQETMAAVRITFPAAKGLFLEVLVTNGSSVGESCGTFKGNTGIEVTQVFYCPPNTIGNRIRIQDYLDDPDLLQLREVEVFAKREMTCLLPDIPANGFGAKTLGKSDVYRYFCARGYVLNGTDATRCHPNGTWYPRAPVCEDIFCEPPATPTDGFVEYDVGKGGVPFGGTANYSCSEGYSLEGKAIRKCIGQNTWSSQKSPKCVAVECGNFSFQIKNGRLLYSNLSVNSVAKLRCDDGYRPTHNDTLVCQSNGRWSPSMLRCEPIRCEKTNVIPHGRMELLDGSTYYGSRLRIICDHGFKLTEDELRMCNKNGSWGEFNSSCLEVVCPPFPLDIEGGSWTRLNKSDTGTSIGIKFALECLPGYQLIGDFQFTICLENGTWLETNSYCLEVKPPNLSMSTQQWSPKTMMMTAMGIGVGSAVCILCLVAGVFLVRRKSQYRNSPPVFHVGIPGKPIRDNFGLLCNKTSTIDNHYYSTAAAIYEEVEHRTPPLPKQRKPRSALPPTPPPLDADAEYSQPFEDISSGVSRVIQDDEQAHIYAEPVDAYSLSSECQQNLENQKKDKSVFEIAEPRHSNIRMENSVIYETAGNPVTIDLDMISNDIYLESRTVAAGQ